MPSIRQLKPDYTGNMDYEKEICHECPKCESNLWNVKVSFECAICGTYATAPTPIDKPF